MLTYADDLSLTPNLVFDGILEAPLTKYFISVIKQGDVIFDLGANIGYNTLLLGYLTEKKGKLLLMKLI